ncbi:zinc finger protein 260 isoform X2 [Solenopsis invicta]|uniref:zinc finger protein 260 isoform X2 n=1 Tax=Solenopsis invicta TaxID=13686 RepID=UPI000596029E|nr:zinc finger protein 260 isoform X2 [Solenopsis invicta]
MKGNMIIFNEFGRCAATSEKCPNCEQPANASFSRLVKDSCGHTKCRMCLLYEEHGCKLCQTESCVKGKDAEDYLKSHIANGELNGAQKSPDEEIVLPLELVINKDFKSKEDSSVNLNSAESGSDIYENTTFDNNEESYESVTNDAITTDKSSQTYIPRIESYDVALNIQNHLRSDSDCDLKDSQNPHVKDDNQEKAKISKDPEKEKSKIVRFHNRNHIITVPGVPEKYKCNVCCKIFRNKKGKCYHDACVTGVKPYQCTLCDKSFVKRSHFEYHERVHRGYKPYKCNLCEKAFPQQNKLNRHMFSHSKEKRFVCPKCNKRYSKKDDLKIHLHIHNTTAVLKCQSCDKSFCILTNLKRHMQTHTNERPHRCDQCNKGFKDKSLLIRHKRTHGKERPFSCAHCNKVFLSKSELRRHLTVHSDEKPFSCEYCQTLFRRKDNLKRHIRHHHNEDFDCEVRKTPTVIEANQSCAAKSSQPRQKQKPKRAQPKSTGKVTVTVTNSREQINSRLDSMGNITPVIRATNEVSNAVPVINGPINIRRLEDSTDREIFTYIKPIPIAEAVVLNRRIEEKLYPQSASSHNYFVDSCLKDGNSKVNSYPNNNLVSRENHDFTATTSSQIEALVPRVAVDQKDPTVDVYEKRIERCEKEKSDQSEDENAKENEGNREERRNFNDPSQDLNTVSFRESHCVSTIKKHITQQSQGYPSKNSTNNSNLDATNHTLLPKNSQNSCEKKQSDIHWRRRIAEKLKPC